MIAFTICSNNYIAEALTLGDSLMEQGLAVDHFIIFLCDKKSALVTYERYKFQIIEITEEIVPEFFSMTKRYRLVELNTAVKPSIFKFLIQKYSETYFCYLDPDLFFYQSLDSLEAEIGTSSALLTPHVLKPKSLTLNPPESVFLNFGIYNLGFLLIRNDENSQKMLDWWEERTVKMGYDKPASGLFVDQLWMNLAPIYFNEIKISKHSGLNMAYWNLNERTISIDKQNHYRVNQQHLLVFFHFSSFDHELKQLSKRGSSIEKEEWPIILEMMINYQERLKSNSLSFFKKIKVGYKVSFEEYLDNSLPGKTLSTKELTLLKIIKKIIPKTLIQKLTNLNHKIEVIDRYDSVL